MFFSKVRGSQDGAGADRLSRVGLRGSEVRVILRQEDCDCEREKKKLATTEYLCSLSKVFISDRDRQKFSAATVCLLAKDPELDTHSHGASHESADGQTGGRLCDRKVRTEPTPLIGISNNKMLYLILLLI